MIGLSIIGSTQFVSNCYPLVCLQCTGHEEKVYMDLKMRAENDHPSNEIAKFRSTFRHHHSGSAIMRKYDFGLV